MNTIRTHSRMTRLRGSIGAIALVLLAISSLASLLMVQTLLDHQRINKRRRELARAFYAAEGGVAQVLHWANYPADYTADSNMFATSGSASADYNSQFTNLISAIGSGGYTMDESMLASMGAGDFDSTYNYQVSQINQIQLLSIPPAGVLAPADYDFIIRSVGESPDGLQRTVLAFVKVNTIISNPNIAVPAALISLAAAGANGNAKIHWGEAWSKDDFSMLNKSQMGYAQSDADVVYRTEGTIDFPNNWQTSGGNPDVNPALPLPGIDEWDGIFEQFIASGTLQWPDFASEYQAFKNQAISNGRYYTTDSSGNIFLNGTQVDFGTEFATGHGPTDPYDFVFIDTIDGNPPAADGSNLATVTNSGNSSGMKGVYYVNAHFAQTGVGSPPALSADDPYGGTESLSKIFLDGLLYIAGGMSMGGNAGVYGSVVTEGSWSGNGTLDIYYNAALAAGLPIAPGNVGSTFTLVRQVNMGG